jgi:acyl-CoA reductase-like NAD-dependent aldehyde dehydrogenase
MQEPATRDIAKSINPTTGELIKSYQYLDDAGINRVLDRSHAAFQSWSRTDVASRAAVLRDIADRLRRGKAELAHFIALEMGKPLAEAEAEVEKSAWNCEYVAEQGPAWLADEVVDSSARHSHVSYLPLGPVLSILPWNFPVWQIFRCAASALMVGNTIVMKHAPNVLGCAELIAELIASTGAPADILVHLNAPVAAMARVIADPRIAAVALTGSPAAGAKVAAQAGACCKKTVLELGGSDAFIVLADADIEAAVQAGVRARFTNCGQVCLAAKRFVLEAPIAAEYAERFTAAAAALRCGDPLDRSTQMGPMARGDLREELERQLAASVAGGARVTTGGRRGGGRGWQFEPTVLTEVPRNTPAFTQEIFGPVAALVTARNTEEAVAIANDSVYGLSAMLWTADLARARQIARQLQVGGVFINAVTASDPRLPVGGVKLSGYGRELGKTGMRELCNVQTVWVS